MLDRVKVAWKPPLLLIKWCVPEPIQINLAECLSWATTKGEQITLSYSLALEQPVVRRCSAECGRTDSTKDIKPREGEVGILGQQLTCCSLRLGLNCNQVGQHLK